MQMSFSASTVKSTKATRMVVAQAKKDNKVAQKAVAGLLSVGFVLAAAPSFAVDAEMLADGKKVFTSNCAACHLGGNNSVLTDKTLKKEAIEKYLEGGLTLDAIKYQVNNGKGAMPAWADRLDEDDIEAVSNFVYDQAVNSKW